jgi:hypothetical protein
MKNFEMTGSNNFIDDAPEHKNDHPKGKKHHFENGEGKAFR